METIIDKDIHAAIAVQTANVLTNFPSEIRGVSIKTNRPSKGEIRKFGMTAFILPILVAAILLPIVAFFLIIANIFIPTNSQQEENIVFVFTIILPLISVLIVAIIFLYRGRFSAKVKRVVNEGQRTIAKIIEVSRGTKYAATTRSSGGKIVLIIVYEYQNTQAMTKQVKVKFPLEQESYFYKDKELNIIASHDDKLNIIIK